MTIKFDSHAIPPHAIPRVAAPRADERWREGLGGRRLSTVAIVFVAVSLALHAALLIAALLGAHAEAQRPPQEIPIEVVQEAPPAAEPAKPARQSPAPPPPAAAKPAPPPPPPQPAAADRQRAELERQLDELKSERQALDELKSEQQALKQETAGLGPLRDSIHAVALPSAGDGGEGDLVGYQSLVFSQLAKAKDGAHEAAAPATVGVRFSVDDDGKLVDVAVAVSSGVADLDAESLAIVRRAAPFPKPPAGAEHAFSANFAYAGAKR